MYKKYLILNEDNSLSEVELEVFNAEQIKQEYFYRKAYFLINEKEQTITLLPTIQIRESRERPRDQFLRESFLPDLEQWKQAFRNEFIKS